MKVADFGLARSLLQGGTEADPINPVLTDYVATRWYRAPEILLGAPAAAQPPTLAAASLAAAARAPPPPPPPSPPPPQTTRRCRAPAAAEPAASLTAGSTRYGKAVDMWSLGCIFGEMLSGKPCFPGTSTLNQLEKICEIIGKPTEEQIRAMQSPFAATMLDSLQYPAEAKGWSSLFPNASPTALDLLVKLMQFDPNNRAPAPAPAPAPRPRPAHRPDPSSRRAPRRPNARGGLAAASLGPPACAPHATPSALLAPGAPPPRGCPPCRRPLELARPTQQIGAARPLARSAAPPPPPSRRAGMTAMDGLRHPYCAQFHDAESECAAAAAAAAAASAASACSPTPLSPPHTRLARSRSNPRPPGYQVHGEHARKYNARRQRQEGDVGVPRPVVPGDKQNEEKSQQVNGPVHGRGGAVAAVAAAETGRNGLRSGRRSQRELDRGPQGEESNGGALWTTRRTP